MKIKASTSIVENLLFDMDISFALTGGYDDLFVNFHPTNPYTTMTGSLLISEGKVTISNLIIK